MGAYITFGPRPGVTTDSERNCVSNISAQGLSLESASRRILALMAHARTMRRTGTLLKEDDVLGLLPLPPKP
jgi:ethanolamine ammonia-lyase small subunit